MSGLPDRPTPEAIGRAQGRVATCDGAHAANLGFGSTGRLRWQPAWGWIRVRPVVFVMSDVVGSTVLWEAHGDSMRVAVELHDELVHGAMQAGGGRVFKHTGDGMLAAFDDADQAAEAALLGARGAGDVRHGARPGPLEIACRCMQERVAAK